MLKSFALNTLILNKKTYFQSKLKFMLIIYISCEFNCCKRYKQIPKDSKKKKKKLKKSKKKKIEFKEIKKDSKSS